MVEEKEAVSFEDVKKEMLEFCLQAQCRTAILEHILVAVTSVHYTKYIAKLLRQRCIKTNLSEKRSARPEKYIITQKGLNYLKAIAY